MGRLVRVHFATHATTRDNEQGIASGHRDVELSPDGRAQARTLADALKGCGFDVVCCSPLRRAHETAAIAFEGRYPLLVDGRLSEIDYGAFAGTAVAEVDRLRGAHVAIPFPGGESYEQRLALVGTFLKDFAHEHDGKTPLLIGHRATFYCLLVLSGRRTFKEAFAEPFEWQPFWTFEVDIGPDG